jgi:hypothetical protein
MPAPTHIQMLLAIAQANRQGFADFVQQHGREHAYHVGLPN